MAKIASICLMLSIVANRHRQLYQIDFKNVILHGELKEDVYMEQPLGLVAQWQSILVWRLHWSIYGLKQSSCAWFGQFS